MTCVIIVSTAADRIEFLNSNSCAVFAAMVRSRSIRPPKAIGDCPTFQPVQPPPQPLPIALRSQTSEGFRPSVDVKIEPVWWWRPSPMFAAADRSNVAVIGAGAPGHVHCLLQALARASKILKASVRLFRGDVSPGDVEIHGVRLQFVLRRAFASAGIGSVCAGESDWMLMSPAKASFSMSWAGDAFGLAPSNAFAAPASRWVCAMIWSASASRPFASGER